MTKTFLLNAASAALLGACCLGQSSSQSPLDELKKRAEDIMRPKSQSGGLTDDKIVTGLKQALSISTKNAVASTGRVDGFLKNQAIKILLPEKMRNAGKALRMVGMGRQVDELEVGMNRAAEQAVPAARQIFLNALTQMTFQDARQILSGGDTAATEYFKRASTSQLAAAFKPAVHKSMQNVGVVQQYNRVMQNPMVAQAATGRDFSLDDYIVGKTLDGLFYVMGQEEQKIRKDPMKQTTAILREVFGKAATAGR
jgi:Protein of unknown function (DUF4197)